MPPRTLALVNASSRMSGVEFSTLYLARGLDRAAWSPIVICPEEGDLTAQCSAENIPALILPQARFHSTSMRFEGNWFFPAFSLVNPYALVVNCIAVFQTARRLAQTLRTEDPALVVTKSMMAHFYGGLAARLAGIPCVWHVQDRVSNQAGPLFPLSLSLGGRLLAREIIADAETIARQIEKLVPRERITVILNGVDAEEFSPEIDGCPIRAEWKVNSEDFLVGVVSRPTFWKGQHVLIQAIARLKDELPQVRAAIIGAPLFENETYALQLRDVASNLNVEDRVLFTGFRHDMPRVLAALDIYVHTALEKDSSPLAVVSAMAAGKAIICSSVDGTRQLFEDGVDGLLVPPGDACALADKIRLLVHDARLRDSLGRAARLKAVRELSLETFARHCEAVFERALA